MSLIITLTATNHNNLVKTIILIKKSSKRLTVASVYKNLPK